MMVTAATRVTRSPLTVAYEQQQLGTCCDRQLSPALYHPASSTCCQWGQARSGQCSMSRAVEQTALLHSVSRI